MTVLCDSDKDEADSDSQTQEANSQHKFPTDHCMEPSQHLFWKRTLLVSPERSSSSNVFSRFAGGVLQNDMPKNDNPNPYVIDDPVPEKGDWKNPIKMKQKLKQEIVNWVANCVTKLNTRVSMLAYPIWKLMCL